MFNINIKRFLIAFILLMGFIFSSNIFAFLSGFAEESHGLNGELLQFGKEYTSEYLDGTTFGLVFFENGSGELNTYKHNGELKNKEEFPDGWYLYENNKIIEAESGNIMYDVHSPGRVTFSSPNKSVIYICTTRK